MKKWKECLRWKSDEMPETTEAIVVVSKKGKVKCLSYKHWNEQNKSYSIRKDKKYSILTNRGKQRYEKNVCASKGKYQYVTIRGQALSVHRLVAKAFIPNPENKPQVNHIDGNRSNNHYKNLEWVTNSENMEHAIKSGLMRKRKSFESISKKDLRVIESDLKEGISATRISEKLEKRVSHETIRMYKIKNKISVPTKIKKRKRKSDEYYKTKARERWELKTYDDNIINEVMNKYNEGYPKSEVNVANLDDIINKINKTETRINFSINASIVRTIKTEDVGISVRKDTGKYRFRLGRDIHAKDGFETKEKAIKYKYNFLKEYVKGKVRWEEEYEKNSIGGF